jgi:hypothetical protein
MRETACYYRFSLPNSSRKRRTRAPRSRARRNRTQVPANVGGRAYDIARTSSTSLTMNSFYGFGASGFYDLQLDFSLSDFRVYLNGILASTVTIPNSSEFSSLWDLYQISKVDVTFFYTHNLSGMGSPAYAMPIFWVVDDPNSADATVLTAIQQYPKVRAHYLGESGGAPVRISVSPRPTTRYGESSTAGNGTLMPAQWISTASPTVRHYGVKLCWDTSGRVTNLDVGNINIVVKLYFKFKAPI